jgi:hypothetical protein
MSGMSRKTEALRAVHDDDLSALLESLGVAGDVTQGRAKCSFCHDIVTMETLHAVFGDSGAVKFACSRPECVKQLLARLGERRYGG